MKKALLTAALIMVTAAAQDVAAATVNLPINAELVKPLEIVQTRGIKFGQIARFAGDTQTRTVRLHATNLYKAGSGGDCNVTISCLGSPEAAFIRLSGIQNAPYSVTMPSSVTISNGSDTLVVQNFNLWTAGNSTLYLPNGEGYGYIGADLIVPANASTGTYNGTFDVVANYN